MDSIYFDPLKTKPFLNEGLTPGRANVICWQHKSQTLDAGFGLEEIRLNRPSQHSQALNWAITELTQLSLLLRIKSSSDDTVRQYRRHFAHESLHALARNFNAQIRDRNLDIAPLPDWNGKCYDYHTWRAEVLLWLDTIITAMHICREGVGTRSDFTRAVCFCAAWHAQCSDALDEEDLVRRFAA